MKEKVRKFVKKHKKMVAAASTVVIIAGAVYIFSGTEAGYKVKMKIAGTFLRSVAARNRDYVVVIKYHKFATEDLKKALLEAIEEA